MKNKCFYFLLVENDLTLGDTCWTLFSKQRIEYIRRVNKKLEELFGLNTNIEKDGKMIFFERFEHGKVD